MKLALNEINSTYIAVEPVLFNKKENLIILTANPKKYMIGRILEGLHEGKYCMFNKHDGLAVDDFDVKVILVPKGYVIAFVEPSDDEEVVPFEEFKKASSADNEWVNVIATNQSKGVL